MSSAFMPPIITQVIDGVNTKVIHISDGIAIMETIGQRLKRLREAKGLSQGALAKEAGLKSQGTIGNIEGEIRKYGESIVDIARVLSTTPDYLRCLTDDPGKVIGAPVTNPSSMPAQYSVSAEPEEGYVRLPIMAEAGAGNGCEALPEVVSYIDVLESYVRRQLGANPRTIKVLTARGNSMTGQIEDGDIMFVEQTSEFTDDGIYILTLDNLVRVKRLSVSALSQQVIIESNDGRKAEELPLKDVPHRLHIQGRVVGAWSLRRFS